MRRLVQALFEYTRDTIARFRDAGVLPDMVQIGNEITNGMLWPDARLPANWDNFADFMKAGIAGVEAGKGNMPRPRIMIHIDKGGDQVATRNFFDKLNTYQVNYDVIGQSYYPWWHGSLNDLREKLMFMAKEYGKDIIVVEAAYNWTPGNYRAKPGPFPETPEGQKEFWEEVNRTVQAAPDGTGIGVFWWEPAVAGGTAARGFFDRDRQRPASDHGFRQVHAEIGRLTEVLYRRTAELRERHRDCETWAPCFVIGTPRQPGKWFGTGRFRDRDGSHSCWRWNSRGSELVGNIRTGAGPPSYQSAIRMGDLRTFFVVGAEVAAGSGPCPVNRGSSGFGLSSWGMRRYGGWRRRTAVSFRRRRLCERRAGYAKP